jgi:hypothetical protein
MRTFGDESDSNVSRRSDFRNQLGNGWSSGLMVKFASALSLRARVLYW